MMRSVKVVLLIAPMAMLLVGADNETAPEAKPRHDAPEIKNGNVVVALCDGKTSIEVQGLKPGETMDPARARKVADDLMLSWIGKNPGVKWDMAAAAATDAKKDAKKDAKGKLPAPGEVSPDKKQVEAYGNYTSRDE